MPWLDICLDKEEAFKDIITIDHYTHYKNAVVLTKFSTKWTLNIYNFGQGYNFSFLCVFFFIILFLNICGIFQHFMKYNSKAQAFFWCSYPQRVSKLKAAVRYMFHNPEDVRWFKVRESICIYKIYMCRDLVYIHHDWVFYATCFFTWVLDIAACGSVDQMWSSGSH